MQGILVEIDCAARSDAKVLITGETGAGKEVVARLIHDRSARARAPIMTVNCAGLPESLLESELFGHVRGSFTGAYRDKPGLLELAPGGTVFLDEVGEMSMRMQATMLRFLDTGEVQRVGATRPHARADVRLVTATNRDLLKQIANGTFREDLYFRLNVIRLCLPALRERKDDIPLLIDHFLETYCRKHQVPRPEFSPATMDILVAHRWAGNVRELKNVVERIVLKVSGVVRPCDLPSDIFVPAVRAAVSDVERGPELSPRRVLMNDLTARVFERGESFWTSIYPVFMSRDITRDDLRNMVRLSLERTNGNYRLMVQLLNMPSQDYKGFLSFLRKHDCHLPFQRFRTARVGVARAVSAAAPAEAVAH